MTWTTLLVGIPWNLRCRSQREAEDGAAAGVRSRPEVAAVGLDDRLADRQPDAHALRLGGDERLKQLRHHIRSDTAAGVGNTALDHSLTRRPAGDRQLA